MRKAYEKKKIDFKKYINVETGETLGSELKGAISINVRNEDKVFMHDESYYIMGSEASLYLDNEFSDAERGRIISMCNMAKGEYNLLYRDDNGVKKPHTKETLMDYLDITVNRFRDFMNKLYAKNIICPLIESRDGVKKKWFMINPYLARKQKGFNAKCANQFQKLVVKKDI